MNCEKCGKEIDYLSIDTFDWDGSDSFETLPITEDTDGSVYVDVEPNWTGYGLSEEEMPETIRCPECGQFPLENREIHAHDMVRVVLFRKEHEAKERIRAKMKNFKPCPFCGGTELKAGTFAMDTQCHVDCECGAEIWLTVDRKEGMTVEEHDEACIDALLAAWNRQAADVSPVVRCRDCKYWHRALLKSEDGSPVDFGICDFMKDDIDTDEKDFCSRGERIKENE